MQVTPQHPEAIGERAGISVKKRFLLDRIALRAGSIAPRDKQRSAAVVADFADAGLALGDGTAMSAGEAANPVVLELLVKTGIRFADSLVENTAQGGHNDL
jgi:hypothetical protein